MSMSFILVVLFFNDCVILAIYLFQPCFSPILTMMLIVFYSTHSTRLWCSMIGEMAYLWLSLSFRGHVNKISAQFFKRCMTGFKGSKMIGYHPLLSLTML